MRGQLEQQKLLLCFQFHHLIHDVYKKNGTSLSYHKSQFLLIQVHLNILHQLYVLFSKRVLKMAFENDSGSAKKMEKIT